MPNSQLVAPGLHPCIDVSTISPVHELVFDLRPPVKTDDGRLYDVTVVARRGPDGHWNAWLEFVAHGSQDVLGTGIETHQSTEADLQGWSTTLSDVYLCGALERARVSRLQTDAHRRALDVAAKGKPRSGMKALDLSDLFARGEHVLWRELPLLRRAALLSLIVAYHLNPKRLDLSRFTKAQLVAFIVTAMEVRQAPERVARRNRTARAASSRRAR